MRTFFLIGIAVVLTIVDILYLTNQISTILNFIFRPVYFVIYKYKFIIEILTKIKVEELEQFSNNIAKYFGSVDRF